jgi:hypothetical protein
MNSEVLPVIPGARASPSLTSVDQPNNCNHGTQLFAWCAIVLGAVLKKKKREFPLAVSHECKSRQAFR